MTTSIQPYAACTDCDAEFPDRPAVDAHMNETLAAAQTLATAKDQPGFGASSHSIRTLNPTPEEAAASRARGAVASAVEDALMECFDDLAREIRLGYVTEEQVTSEMAYFSDFSDGWDQYRQDGLS